MEETFKYNLSSEESNSLDKLNGHTNRQLRRDPKKKYKCNMCGYEFRTGRELSYHMRTHTGERPFKCNVNGCEMTFKQESTLNYHIKRKHSDKRPVKCDFADCLYTGKTTADLTKHRKLHSTERPFACSRSGCNYRAKRKSTLSEHKANAHSDFKRFSCSKCSFWTNFPRSLKRHMIVHEDKNENISCSIEGCEYKGKNNRALKEHVYRHKFLLPCPVAGCGRYAATKEAIKAHVKLHNPSARPFQCPLCCKHFSTLKDLQKHCVVHTNEKPFKCGHCEFTAARQRDAKRHISSVHAAIVFPFAVCLPDDRECLRCKVTLPSDEFLEHCKGHVRPVAIM